MFDIKYEKIIFLGIWFLFFNYYFPSFKWFQVPNGVQGKSFPQVWTRHEKCKENNIKANVAIFSLRFSVKINEKNKRELKEKVSALYIYIILSV